jgi:DNA-binding transcriptional LysR family regulator
MEWGDIRVFLAIAREGTLTAAAHKLGQTQPTLGRRLRALEAAVGNKLFQRTVDGLLLTNEGHAMLAPAERMEKEAFAIDRQTLVLNKDIEGLLRLTTFDWFGPAVIAPLLAAFARLHPRITIEMLTDPRFLNLSRREADLAFRIGSFSEPDVVSRKLMRIHYACYIRRGFKHPVPGDGADCALVTLDSTFSGTPDDSWLNKLLPNARVGFRSNSRQMQAQVCANGLGVAILPVLLAETIPKLERVDLGGEPPARDVWVGYHRDLRHQTSLRTLLEFVVAKLAELR